MNQAREEWLWTFFILISIIHHGWLKKIIIGKHIACNWPHPGFLLPVVYISLLGRILYIYAAGVCRERRFIFTVERGGSLVLTTVTVRCLISE